MQGLCHVATSASIFLTVSITAERLAAVCFPHNYQVRYSLCLFPAMNISFSLYFSVSIFFAVSITAERLADVCFPHNYQVRYCLCLCLFFLCLYVSLSLFLSMYISFCLYFSASIFLTVSITAERLAALCYPHNYQMCYPPYFINSLREILLTQPV